MLTLSRIPHISSQVLEHVTCAGRPFFRARPFHATPCPHNLPPHFVNDERPAEVAFRTSDDYYDDSLYHSGVVSTLRPERLAARDVLHVPEPAYRIQVAFNPPVADKSNPAVTHTPSPDLILDSPSARRSNTVNLRASLYHSAARFPPGWGCLYWWTPSSGGSTAITDGEVRYRSIASVASVPRAWPDKVLRNAFERSPDYCLEDGVPWRSNLFAAIMRRMAYAENLVTPQDMTQTLGIHFAERYMEQRRVQAMTDPSLGFLATFPTVDHNTILPNPDQFSIPEHTEDAIRAWENDPSPLRVYSDGALHQKKWMGAAAVLERVNRRKKFALGKTQRVHLGRMPPPHNVSDGEIVGLGVALSLAAEELNVGRLTVYSDSQLALQAVCSSAARPRQWRLADYVLARYDLLMRRHPKAEVMFRWIPSHIGVDGNEMADTLAHQAAKPPNTSRREVLVG